MFKIQVFWTHLLFLFSSRFSYLNNEKNIFAVEKQSRKLQRMLQILIELRHYLRESRREDK